MIALRASYQFRLATPSYDVLSGSLKLQWQSYHNVPKTLITLLITLNSISAILFTFKNFYGIITLKVY